MKSAKTNLIIANFPLITFITLGIYPLIARIIACVHHKEAQNSGLALACGILSILCVFCLVTFILAFFIKA